MAIIGYTEEDFLDELAEFFSPSKEIDREERLFGRDLALRTIRRAFHSPGRQIFVYGDRGIGKSSVAITAAHLNNNSESYPIRVDCSNHASFEDVFDRILNYDLEPKNRLERKSTQLSLGASYQGTGGEIGYSSHASGGNFEIRNPSDAIDVVRIVGARNSGRRVIVIDEFDRVRGQEDREKFAEFIKMVSAIEEDVRFIFCGIGSTIDEIMGAHASSGRYLEPVFLDKIHHNYLHDIIHRAAQRFNVSIPANILQRIGIISDGFPHYVHLIGQEMFLSAFDEADNLAELSLKHFKKALDAALSKSEPYLRLSYQKATEKTKNHSQYEQTLWALADKSESRRQVTNIFNESLNPMLESHRDLHPMDKNKLNARLLNLREDRHGAVVIGHGAGWFSFRENVFRGYVRMVAESRGVRLREEH